MSRRFVARLCAVLFLGALSLSAQITFTDPGFTNEKIIGGFSAPVGFAYAPDGRIFVWEKQGRVKIVKNGVLLATPFLDISTKVNSAGDRGLLGLALDPDYATNGYVYLGYVLETGGDVVSKATRTSRVVRVQSDPANRDRALAGSETVILGSKTTGPCNAGEDCMIVDVATHSVDTLAFGPDGKLWVSVGDGADYSAVSPGALRAQSLDSLNGKLLRVNKDGSAPGDNPWDDGTNSVRSKIYSYGFRNPFRFSFDANGEAIVGDVGWATWEEINRGRGKNFGWPCYEGNDPQPKYQPAFTQCQSLFATDVAAPLHTYVHTLTVGGSIIIGPRLDGAPYPAKYNNNIYFADYSNQWLKRAVLDSSGNISNVVSFGASVAGPVFMMQGPDNNLHWLSISTGSIYRIRYTGAANRPPVAKVTATPSAGLSPLDVSLSSAGSTDPDNDDLTYAWNFGDGQTSTVANPVHRYTASGVAKFTVTLTVTDPSNASAQDSVVLTVGSTAPQVTIAYPANGVTVNPNASVPFSGSATDAEDGNLPPSALRWSVVLHHNTHSHLMQQFTGASGSFTADLPDTIDLYWYELTLEATDSSGVTSSKTVRINLRYTPSGGSCTLKTTDPSVTICTPTAGSTVASPVRVVAGTTNASGVKWMKVYIDGVGLYGVNAASLDTSLPVAAGLHRLTVQSSDRAGRIINETRNFTVVTGCTPGPTNPSITVCLPANGSTVSSPVHILASTTNSAGVTAIKVYVDNVVAYSTSASTIDARIPMAVGTRRIVVQSWDRLGRVVKQPVTITVSP